MGKPIADFVQFISTGRLEKFLEAEFEQFGDDSPEARQWEACVEKAREFLGQFSQDEEAIASDGSPGFLLGDIWQGVMTISLEFNDPALFSKTVLETLAEITSSSHPEIEFGITFYLPGKDEEHLEMVASVLRKGVVYLPNSKKMKNAVNAWG